MSRNVLIIGCGFIGEATADLLFQEGWAVLGTCATRESAQQLRHKPFPLKICDVSQEVDLYKLSKAPPDLVLFCASSQGGGANEYRNLYLRGVQNILQVWPSAKLLFTSSTSVYAQTQGELVDENSPTEPTRTTGQILIEAEHEVLSAGGTIARLAGIYGPGRSVLMKKFLTKEAILEDGGQRWINQIHRDDASRAFRSLIDAPPGIYNVCDDRPATQYEIYQWLAEFFHQPLPPCGPPDFHRKRGWTSKRVSNRKLRSLHWKPQWPSYRIALPKIALTVKGKMMGSLD